MLFFLFMLPITNGPQSAPKNPTIPSMTVASIGVRKKHVSSYLQVGEFNFLIIVFEYINIAFNPVF
jgi:hypothetical protein